MTTVASTTPYAWPFDGVIDPAVTALVVTGCDVATSEAVDDATASRNIEVLRSALASVGVLVVLVAHDALDPAENRIAAAPDEVIVRAAGLDGFYGSPLDVVLSRAGRTHLLVAGLGFETTVHSTLRRANDRGYECLLIADACACVDETLRPAAISIIEMSGGIFGAVGTTADAIAAYVPPPPDIDPTDPFGQRRSPQEEP